MGNGTIIDNIMFLNAEVQIMLCLIVRLLRVIVGNVVLWLSFATI